MLYKMISDNYNLEALDVKLNNVNLSLFQRCFLRHQFLVLLEAVLFLQG